MSKRLKYHIIYNKVIGYQVNNVDVWGVVEFLIYTNMIGIWLYNIIGVYVKKINKEWTYKIYSYIKIF